MHPDPTFAQGDRDALLAQAAAIGFAHVVVGTPAGPAVVHAPLTLAGGNVRFHVARANRITPHLPDARVLASVAGPQGYISPSWYPDARGQVPTWNFVAIEIEGVARRLSEAELVDQLDALAAAHEPRVTERPWTRDKLADAPFRAMLGAIAGFEIVVDAVRGTAKLSQNKSAATRAGVIAGLVASGNRALAEAMR